RLDPPASPVCVQNKCAPCTQQPDACATRTPALPVCAPTGACVECTADQHCTTATKPICDTATNKCAPCTGDAQCVKKGGAGNSGICMFHQDGHCASDAEVIYVQNAA